MKGGYPLTNIVVITLCAVLSGCDDLVAIADWAEIKKDWLAKFLDLSAGVPSHDRFNMIFRMLDPAEFEQCLLSWITTLHEVTDGQIVAIDGKTLRRSFDKASSKAAIRVVSAWATANSISLGQVVVDEKSNEITAIPKLLEIIAVSGCLVTIDAMGCQKEIARKIIDKQADYVLAVKENQPTLCAAVRRFFGDYLEDDLQRVAHRNYETHEQGHGRVDDRYYHLAKLPTDGGKSCGPTSSLIRRSKSEARLGVGEGVSTHIGRGVRVRRRSLRTSSPRRDISSDSTSVPPG